jgi:uncharacterized protein YbjT (DUF2867 family)
MKIAIFGATGGVGKELFRQALAAGHEVNAFARDPGKLDMRRDGLRIVQGDVTNPAVVEQAVMKRPGTRPRNMIGHGQLGFNL